MSYPDGNRSAQTRYVKGYPSFAAFIASDTDKSTHIYRRFDRLCARNLLCLQAELAELEAQQDRLDDDDFSATTEQKRYVRNWGALRQKAAEGSMRERERLNVAMKIREKLQQYRSSFTYITTVYYGMCTWLIVWFTRRGCNIRKLLTLHKLAKTASVESFSQRIS